MMRKIFLLLVLLLVSCSAYAQDDDSTPYMPYPEQPQQTEQPKKQPVKKAPAKKKKTTTKKAAPKKKTTKPAAPKVTSLQRGIEAFNQGKYEVAGGYFRKAIQENRNDPNAWYWYGVYSEKVGQFHQAQYFYSKAVKIDPTFDPLSRVVFQPSDSEKTPLWDPKHPARVYPVQTAALKGATSVPAGVSTYPTATNDPETPKVPVYVPPEAGASPLDGDAWSASVYVPPSQADAQTVAYMPPNSRVTTVETEERQTLRFSTSGTRQEQEPTITPEGPMVYTPPTPPKTAKTVKKSAAPTTTTAPKQPATPRKVVKQSQQKTTTAAKKSTATKAPAKKASADVRPARTTRKTTAPKQAAPKQPTTTTPKQQTPQAQPRIQPPVTPIEPERQQMQQERQQQYIPPVGQSTPDPGTITETPIAPVGQN